MPGMTDTPGKTDFFVKKRLLWNSMFCMTLLRESLGIQSLQLKIQLQATYVISEDMWSVGQSQESCW